MGKLLTLSVLSLLVAINSWVFTTFPPRRTSVLSTHLHSDKVKLGRMIFFDTRLSIPAGKSCGSCHNPATSFSDPGHRIVSEGAVHGLFTKRNAPGISYAMFTPSLHFNHADSTYIGGLFLDGRVNTLQEQAIKPFLNPLEMNVPSRQMLVEKIKTAPYYPLFKDIYGNSVDTVHAVNNIADALAAFEKSAEVSPFTSKYDYYLKGQATLTVAELRGLHLFNDSTKGKCANCHSSTPDPLSGKILFTDFTYDNIGVPKNAANPFYKIPSEFNGDGGKAVDYGLGGCLHNEACYGKFKVSTLRNVALSAPYFHNGYFSTLEEVVHFYNKRDVAHYPDAEIPATVNHDETGNLHLTAQEERDIVSFLKTLTDGYKQ